MSALLVVKVTIALLLAIPFVTDVRKAVQHYRVANMAIGEYRRFRYRRGHVRTGMSALIVLVTVVMFLLRWPT